MRRMGQGIRPPADHPLGDALPIGREMSRISMSLTDQNGQAHECLAEAFDMTFNIVILVYRLKALTAKNVILSN